MVKLRHPSDCIFRKSDPCVVGPCNTSSRNTFKSHALKKKKKKKVMLLISILGHKHNSPAIGKSSCAEVLSWYMVHVIL